jgi:chromate transport protein ChrA
LAERVDSARYDRNFGIHAGADRDQHGDLRGLSVRGYSGSFLATLAISLPSFIIIVSIAGILRKFNENFYVKSAFYGLRPAVTGLIVLPAGKSCRCLSDDRQIQFNKESADLVSLKALILAGVLYFLIAKFKKHPIYYILGRRLRRRVRYVTVIILITQTACSV